MDSWTSSLLGLPSSRILSAPTEGFRRGHALFFRPQEVPLVNIQRSIYANIFLLSSPAILFPVSVRAGETLVFVHDNESSMKPYRLRRATWIPICNIDRGFSPQIYIRKRCRCVVLRFREILFRRMNRISRLRNCLFVNYRSCAKRSLGK